MSNWFPLFSDLYSSEYRNLIPKLCRRATKAMYHCKLKDMKLGARVFFRVQLLNGRWIIIYFVELVWVSTIPCLLYTFSFFSFQLNGSFCLPPNWTINY